MGKDNKDNKDNKDIKMSLVVTHDAGFFSCCSMKLFEIINYFNKHKKLPDSVDSSAQFKLYKQNGYENEDVTFDYFERYDHIPDEITWKEDIYYHWCQQFQNYSEINYEKLIPFIKKYFSPSVEIKELCNKYIHKYNIDINNCIGLYYRGTDKHIETRIDSFDNYYDEINILMDITRNENYQIFIQTDSSSFIDYMKEKCINKRIVIIDELSTSYSNLGIHFENSSEKNYEEMKHLFASFLILSKCKYIIHGSCNGSVWFTFYRGNNENTIQNLHYGGWNYRIVS